jgi:phosphoribosylanthranilate isomerase
VEHAQVTAAAGASAIGLMFAPSRRRIDVDVARTITASLSPSGPLVVGVFVNAGPEELLSTQEAAGLDVIQLSGDEPTAITAQLAGARVWKALRFPVGTRVETARRMIEPWLERSNAVEAVLIDAAVAGAYGGTGHRADWQLIGTLAEEYPLVLAGGLDPRNVAGAIDQVGPTGVDVSSGVEMSGQKDAALIEEFIKAAREAFRRRRTLNASS